jgi:putative tricarboxylic transport membrane protein
MYVGNIMLVILNVPFVSVFVNFLRIPYKYLVPTILVVCICGVYSVSFRSFDIVIMVVAGIIGYILRKFSFDLATLIMGIVLGDRIELSFRRALATSGGDFMIFIKSSFSQIFLAAVLLILVLQLGAWLMGFRIKKHVDP